MRTSLRRPTTTKKSGAMKRSATSASKCFERISSNNATAQSASRRHTTRAHRELSTCTATPRRFHCLNAPRPPPTTQPLRSPTRIRTYTSTASQSTSSREDISPFPSKLKTHYDFFPRTLSSGPPPSGPFTIDLLALKREFLQLQAIAHPDRHHGANKARAEALSSAINEAYKTLEDPLRRANYLLELKGVETEECDKLGGEFVGVGKGDMEGGQDMELLMEVMEAREAVEEAETEDEVRGLKKENDGRVAQSVGVLEEAFRDGDLGRAKREAVRLRYWRNIGESLREWEGKGSAHVLQH